MPGLVQEFSAAGVGVYAVEYPGYGPMSDRAPTEGAVYRAASAALEHLQKQLRVPVAQTVTLDALSGKEIFARRLNAVTAEVAAIDPDSFRAQAENLAAFEPLQLTLAPFEVLCLDARELAAK